MVEAETTREPIRNASKAQPERRSERSDPSNLGIMGRVARMSRQATDKKPESTDESVICPRCRGQRIYCALCDDHGFIGKELATAYRLLAEDAQDKRPWVSQVQKMRGELAPSVVRVSR